MRITDIFHELLYDRDRLTLTFDIKDRHELTGKLAALGTIDPNAEYDLSITKKRKSRSKDANAYMWILADKIADKIYTNKYEVYREAIRRVGIFTDVTVRTDAVNRMVDTWGNQGVGWFTEKIANTDNGRVVRLYYGSSTYNTKEMARLIDDLVEEAKRLDIETATPDELEHMKQTWRAL